MMSKSIFKRILGTCLAAVAVLAAVMYQSGPKIALLLVLILATAFLNGMFLAGPFSILKTRDVKNLAVFGGAVVCNFVLLYYVDFNPLIGLVVWLPAIAAVAAVHLSKVFR